MQSFYSALTGRSIELFYQACTLVRLNGKGFNGGNVTGNLAIYRIDARYNGYGVVVPRFGFASLGGKGKLDGIAEELITAVNCAVEDGEFGNE